MSTRHRLSPRRARGAASALLAAALAGSLGLVSSVAAQPPPTVTALSADAARQAGRDITTTQMHFGSQRLMTVSLPTGSDRSGAPADDPGEAERQRRDAMRLLDVAGDGSVAIADAIDDPGAGLLLAAPSGAQLLVSMPGVTGAAFAPTGGWLAVVDGLGRLWRVDTTRGSATALADGPFAGAVSFRASGALLLIALPSMEAPFAASLVSVDPDSGHVRPVDGGDALGLVLAASELADGGIATVSHQPGGGVSLGRLANGAASRVATLAPDATDVSIAADGRSVAYALADGGIFLLRLGDGNPVSLGPGALPRIAADGRAVAVLRGRHTVVVDEAGRALQEMTSSLAAWMRPTGACGGCAS